MTSTAPLRLYACRRIYRLSDFERGLAAGIGLSLAGCLAGLITIASMAAAAAGS